MPQYKSNPNFRENKDCAVFLHGFNTKVPNWDKYREQCYQDLKNRYNVYVKKFDIGKRSESAYVHLKEPAMAERLKSEDKYLDPKTNEHHARIRLAGTQIIVYPYIRDRKHLVQQQEQYQQQNIEQQQRYHLDSYCSSSSSKDIQPFNDLAKQIQNVAETSEEKVSHDTSERRVPDRQETIVPNYEREDTVKPIVTSGDKSDFEDDKNSNFGEAYNYQNKYNIRDPEILLPNFSDVASNHSYNTQSEGLVDDLQHETFADQPHYIPSLSPLNLPRDSYLQTSSFPMSPRGSAVGNEYAPDDQVMSPYSRNHYASTSRSIASRARSEVSQSADSVMLGNESIAGGFETEDENLDENDFEIRFQKDLKNNLPEIFWQLTSKNDIIEALRTVYKKSRDDFLASVIQYSLELKQGYELMQRQQQQIELQNYIANYVSASSPVQYNSPYHINNQQYPTQTEVQNQLHLQNLQMQMHVLNLQQTQQNQQILHNQLNHSIERNNNLQNIATQNGNNLMQLNNANLAASEILNCTSPMVPSMPQNNVNVTYVNNYLQNYTNPIDHNNTTNISSCDELVN